MNRECQNCKKPFEITEDDVRFYDRIKVPPPTFCPECRAQRRFVWRNERILYKRPCDAPGHSETLISNYGQGVPFPVYDQEYWWSDNWNPSDYGRDYDFSRPFFEQFKTLLDTVPLPNVSNVQSVESEYCNFTYQVKNCYLVFASDLDEDSAYLYHTIYSKNSFDLLSCKKEELCYESVHSENCYNCRYTFFSADCLNSAFIYNCRNCQDCLGCVNLRNAKYNIFNEQYSKEEYEKEVKKLDLGSRIAVDGLFKKFDELKNKHPRRFATLLQAVNVTGEYISNAKNCHYCFDIEGNAEDSKYIIYGVPDLKDCYDGYGVGIKMERGYEITSSGDAAQDVFFSPLAWSGRAYRYSFICRNCFDIFGCVGLHNKQYCILNKQYTKEEYEKLLPKIVDHMNERPYVDRRGRIYKYGEFFPVEMSPFRYNETIAQEFFPLTKESATEAGYEWKEPDRKSYVITQDPEDLPDNIKDADYTILKQVIGCAHKGECNEQCTTAFKIIPQEFEFYKKMNLPLPRLCPNCRHYQRLKQRNPLKLWHRRCQCAGQKSENGVYSNETAHSHGNEPCPNEFETSYAPERKEIVYCEQCYQSEIV